MATEVNMINPLSGATAVTYDGFSWTMFFFGIFAPIFRGDFKMVVIYFLVACVTLYIGALLVMPFLWNGYHRKALERQGYISLEQYRFQEEKRERKRLEERQEDRDFMMKMKTV